MEQEGLFPALPENLAALSDDELQEMLKEHQVAADLIDSEDETFLAGLEAADVLAQYETGVSQIEAIRAEQARRVEAEAAYDEQKASLAARRKAVEEPKEEEVVEATAEVVEEAAEETTEDDTEEASEEETAEEPELAVVASANIAVNDVTATGSSAEGLKVTFTAPQPLRRPPAPSVERHLKERDKGAVIVATAGQLDIREGKVLDSFALAEAMHQMALRKGKPHKSPDGPEEKFVVARALFDFPPERQLQRGDLDGNKDKIRNVVPETMRGIGGYALTASGGLCAPLEPLYSLPNFASTARPVRDALPSFAAERGGVSVPSVTTIGDITTAISVIEEEEDALGGTFATKSCQDLTCPTWTDVAVTIISHCREYGNLNSRAWPEGIEHENALTMAAHARAAETYLLNRIKSLSLRVNQAQALGAYSDLVDVLLRTRSSIEYNLRSDLNATYRVLAPYFLPDLLAVDVAGTPFDRFQSQAQMVAHLESLGFAVTLYRDDVTGAVVNTQAFAAEVDLTTVDAFPTEAQIAVFPEGEFIHVDSGVLELGVVRDSTLNSTNDYQIFGESFENVARIGPTQGARWITASICPSSEFPSSVTARC